MYSKKSSFTKKFTAAIKRIFHARNVIIISDHKVDHVPLSGVMQLLILVGVLGFFSGISYITGSYMSARSSIREDEKKIVTTSLEKTHINEEMDILKRDLLKLSKNGQELSTYTKFIVDQYASDTSHTLPSKITTASIASENLFGQSNEKLVERISYLESHMQEIKDENEHLVTAIRERTDKKISYFEDLINMTGLDANRLERIASSGNSKGGEDISRATPADAIGEDNAKKDPKIHTENEGGPFIPYDITSFNDSDRELLANVDRLVLLHGIVEKLPLNQPIAGAQVTGPFGKRVDPINGRFAIHPGVDLAGPMDAHIYSASGGKVIAAGRRIAYGNMVDIDHGFGIVTRYAHMSRILVHEGETVRKGQQIGVQGSTGRSTGPHLHYEVRINDRPTNPVKFLHAGEYVLEN